MTAVVIALGIVVVALAFVSIYQARENERLGNVIRDDLAMFVRYVYGVEVGRAFARQAVERERAGDDG